MDQSLNSDTMVPQERPLLHAVEGRYQRPLASAALEGSVLSSLLGLLGPLLLPA